jgi:DNA-binding NtrC family response regulator
VNVRILAATHRDLEQAMRDGTFREDLYCRLNVVTVRIPPLRERREDIPLPLDHFFRKFAEKNRREVTGLTALAIAPALECSRNGVRPGPGRSFA